jgi:phosphoglycerate dehydrogenase-like enzyme
MGERLLAVLHHDAGPFVEELLARHRSDWLDLAWTPVRDRAGLADALRHADVLLHVLDPVDDATMALAPNLRLIQKLGVGVNTIDLEAARARGVAVCNQPGVNTIAAAEHALALLLAALRRLPEYHTATAAGRGWAVDPLVGETCGEIAGRTVGLVGYGAIARRFERVLLALDATVLHTTRTDDRTAAWRTLDELLAESDVVSLHVPLTAGTTRLLDADRLARMKQGAILVNTARGGLVDQAALTAALVDGRLATAGLDVFADEPTMPDDPILACERVVVTPHVAWLTGETLARCLARAVDNCRRLRAGEELADRVA